MSLTNQCMEELFEQEYRDEFSKTILMERQNGPRPGYNPFTIEWLVYRILKREQRVWRDRDKGLLDNSSRRYIWKPFQNYKIWSGRPYPFSCTYYDQRNGLPPTNHYSNSDPLPSAYCGYWYWAGNGSGPFEPFGEAGRLNAPIEIDGSLYSPPFYVPSPKGGFIPPPEDVDTLNSRALSAMIPSVKQGLSYINSLYELKDFVPVVDAIGTVYANPKLYISALVKWFQTTGVRHRHKPLRSLVSVFKHSNEAFLNWNFAIAPLISDIQAIHRLVTSLKSRINDLVGREGKLRKQHFTVRFAEFNDTDEYGPVGFIQPPLAFNTCMDYRARRRIFYEPSVFHAELQYSYNYTAYQKQHAAMLGALDAFGVKFNPRVLWDALPFSFVVDWFVQVGKQFETFKIDNMEPQINIHQYLWSIKRKRQIRVDVGTNPETNSLVPSPDARRIYLPPVNEEAYGRFTGYPVSDSQLLATGSTRYRVVLGASLITALSGSKKKTR